MNTNDNRANYRHIALFSFLDPSQCLCNRIDLIVIPDIGKTEYAVDVHGEDLSSMSGNVPYKRFVEIGEGTHTIMMEKNRMQFFRELMNFLNESDPLALN